MPPTVLVVEYEPRYLDRLRQGFKGRPFSPVYAKDGEEALRAFEAHRPEAIVLSWILPKTSAGELIRTIRERPGGRETKILITVSGYSGTHPDSDASRVGADGLLAKPFSEPDLLGRLADLLGIDPASMVRPDAELGDFSIEPPPQKHPAEAHEAAKGGQKLTASDIFGEVLGEEPPAQPETAAVQPETRALDEEIDDLLSKTLVSLKQKKDAARASAHGSAVNEIDKLVEDTLSGIHRSRKRESPAPLPEVEPEVEPEPFDSSRAEEFERVPISSPIVEPLGEETITARPGSKFGQFVLREKIATGGMAEIWKAQMHGVEGFEKLVAIKRILPHLSADQEFVAMFVDEAKIAARLNHPHITHIYDLGRASGSHYIAMELVDGHDLKSALERAAACDHPMSVELAVFVTSRLAAALDYAHRKEEGLVHRDVSPQNVLISWDGDIKLCDFGIAKATSRVSHTQTGALKGKLQYMSPEQASGKPIDRRSDIFSLGSVLFEMLAQRKLFSGENEASVLDKVREAHVDSPSLFNDEVPEELDRIVLRALAKDPAERYAAAGEMARELDQVLYAFRPAPAAADLAVWMHRIWAEQPLAVPVKDSPAPEPKPPVLPEPAVVVPAVAPVPAAVPAVAPAASRIAPEELAPSARSPLSAAEEPRSKKGLVAVAVLALAAVGGAAGWFLLRSPGGGESSATPALVTTSAAMIAPDPTPAAPATAVTTASESLELPPAQPETAAPAPSAERVDQEVQRRLEIERQRLEQQTRREREAAARPAPILGRTPPAASEEPRQQAPPPAARPAEQPAPPPATTTVAEAAPPPPVQTETVAPVEAAPQPRPTRRGDFVEPGTPGLVEPQLVSLAKVTYPHMAKMRKIEGIVILQALVSETGSVVEAKILRGVKPDAGIDAAALVAVRGASFTPATKDGVAVRTLKTVTIPFKL